MQTFPITLITMLNYYSVHLDSSGSVSLDKLSGLIFKVTVTAQVHH